MDALDIGTKFHMRDGDLTVERFQDCTAIAEHAKALHKAGEHGSSDFKHAAKIPFVMIEAYCNRLNITFAECMQNKVHMRTILNDPANADFRIWKGRV
jgi:hypothetical protein